MEKIAEAHRNRVILEAEAEAEAIRLKGDAEAFALEAKGMAEAEQLARKAEAYKQYKDAAIVDMLVEALPKVIAIFKYWAIVHLISPSKGSIWINQYFSDCR